MKPDCDKCEYRGELPGDCHSHCNHPFKTAITVKGNPTGINRGWFNWPYNFDPVWLQECDGFKVRE